MTDKGKNIAIICYLTVIGFVISIIMNKTERSSFANFHIRQSFGIMLLGALASMLRGINFFGVGLLGIIMFIGVIYFWILGVHAATKGEEKPVPILGEYFQQWFSFIQ